MKKWDLNEVILLVDCYNRIAEKGSESATSASLESYFDEEAEKLSKILREREREEKGTIDDRFRNVPGIKMKLHNIEFLATDGKSGLDDRPCERPGIPTFIFRSLRRCRFKNSLICSFVASGFNNV